MCRVLTCALVRCQCQVRAAAQRGRGARGEGRKPGGQRLMVPKAGEETYGRREEGFGRRAEDDMVTFSPC